MRLPYFDTILARIASGDRDFEEAFWRHVHFGAWDEPEKAYGDRQDSIEAMDRLCRHLIELADIQDGQDVLDVGCGLGGTLATLRARFPGARLTGLNIDERQLEVARRRVDPSVRFVSGDACAMPFEDRSFDRLLAVECVFHFPSRADFLGHVSRVLRPGGNLTLSDWVLPDGVPASMFDHSHDSFWGSYTAVDIAGYHRLAEDAGLRLVHAHDISRHVRPSYHWFAELLGRHDPAARTAIESSRLVMDLGGIAYCTLRLDLSRMMQKSS